jgi:hypothetical protein
MLIIICFVGCETVPAHQTVTRGFIGKTSMDDAKRIPFNNAEFQKLLVQLKPIFEQNGFRCYEDGARGGFSIIEGSVRWASYGDGSGLKCFIKATRKGLRLEINNYVNARGPNDFTPTQAQSETIAHVIQHIGDFLRSNYPDVKLDVNLNG